LRRAFTLIELLIEIAVLSAVAVAVLTAYSASLRSITLAKAKFLASALSSEKLEVLRNMPYDSLATEHGAIYPPGNILDNEEVDRSGMRFNVSTVISYVDDPFDGNADGTIAGKPQDLYPYDYKKAEITVSKIGSSFSTKYSSNFSSKAAETPSNTGIIKLCVVDSSSLPVPEASVTIVNSDVNPPVNIEAITGDDGCIMVPNLPPSLHNSYHLTAAKAGYSTDSTYPRTAQNPNALIPDIDVLAQGVTSQTLVIDRFSKLTIHVLDKAGQPIANSPIHVEGSKRTYFNPDTLKFSLDAAVDGNGVLELPNMEFDDYNFSIPNRLIVAASPYLPAHLLSGVDLSVDLYTSDNMSDPAIFSCLPLYGMAGSNVHLVITGDNIKNGAAAKLIFASTGQEIIGQNTTVDQDKIIEADFDLNGAPIGNWNILIDNGDGGQVLETNGFEVRQ